MMTNHAVVPGDIPGSAPSTSGASPRAYVVGGFAQCYLFGSVVVNLFDWEVNVNFDYADATAHGDHWKVKAFLDADWTARAKGYVAQVTASQYIKQATSSGVPTALTFIGYSDVSATTVLWEGPCFISKGRITVPMGMMEQEIEVISSGPPTVGLG